MSGQGWVTLRALRARLLGLRAVPRHVFAITAMASIGEVLIARWLSLPLWAVVALALAPWFPLASGQLAWVYRHYRWLALLYLVTGIQIGHFFEHVAQEYQLWVLHWPPPVAHGVFGALDIEWVHFVFNTFVIVAVLALLYPFPRNPWLWATAAIAGWHAMEHTAILVVYLRTGLSGTPGLLASGGAMFGGLPITRPDLHFLYNLVETVPLVLAFLHEIRWSCHRCVAGAYPDASASALARASDTIEPLRFLPGQTIIERGQPLEWHYLVVRGRVAVADGGKAFSSGALFPDRLALSSAPAPATIVARTRAEVVALPRSAARLLQQAPRPVRRAPRARTGGFAAVVVAGTAACCLLVAGDPGLVTGLGAAPALLLTVSLHPMHQPSALQGEPFAFEARIRNNRPGITSAYVAFELSRPGSPGTVVFDDWAGAVPGLTTLAIAGTVVTGASFAQTGAFQLTALVKGRVAGPPLLFHVRRPPVTPAVFEDVSASAGTLATLPPSLGCGQLAAGAAWGDLTGDGFPSLYVPSRTGPAHLWVNDGHGHFRDEAVERGVANEGGQGIGAVFVDYDNDGSEDLYVLNANGPNRLYRNDGHGHFVDVAAAAGLADIGGAPTSAAWGDYDGDGWVDLYVTNYGTCQDGSVRTLQYRKGRLFHNERNGTFSDQTALLDRTDPHATMGAGFQATWGDFTGSGRLDLFVANDYVGPRPQGNRFWRNDGRGPDGRWRFTDVSAVSGLGLAMNGMGVAAGDYSREQRLSLVVSNMGPNKLLHNNGDGTFTDVARAARVDRPMQQVGSGMSVTWGAGFYDFNLDGWEDLYVAAGVLGTPTDSADVTQRSELFMNGGRGVFFDLSAASHADDPGLYRGVAFADYDRDGLVDIFVVAPGGPSHLYRNVTPREGRHWLELDLRGTASDRDACGARVLATVAGTKLLRQVSCGSTGLASGSDRVVHLGLGTAPSASRIEIRWPSGVVQRLSDVAGDRYLRVTEPSL